MNDPLSNRQVLCGPCVPLLNFNPNHDPMNGQFTYGDGGGLSLQPAHLPITTQESDRHIPFKDLRVDRQLRISDANAPSRMEKGSEGYKRATDLMTGFEVSDRKHYEKEETYPKVPGNASGVTIGIGYDLGQVTKKEFDADWGGKLTPDQMDRLRPYVGVVRPSRKIAETQLQDIKIPWEDAKDVFAEKTLPKAISEARVAFPEIDNLPPDSQAALVSLVDNRGNGLEDRKGQLTRKHMREIQSALKEGKLNKIPDIFNDMSNLWDNGVKGRRIKEGEVFKKGLSHLR